MAKRVPVRTVPGFPKLTVQGRTSAPWDDLYHGLIARPWPSFLLVLVAAFLGVNLVFATLYYLAPGCFSGTEAHSFERSFYFSVQTLATIGYGNMAPITRYGHIVVTVEALVGLVTSAFLTGLIFAKFSRPTARVLFSNKITVAPRNGVPTMCFRMANYRQNTITEAKLRIFVLVLEKTLEGETHRKPVELKLVRDNNATFILSWTAMHVIDEQSPFFDPHAMARLRKDRSEIYVVLTGTDETFGQVVHSRKVFSLDDIVFGARFADILQFAEDGTRNLNYTKFHDVTPVHETKTLPDTEGRA
jgi:inward rectifier potassium channel